MKSPCPNPSPQCLEPTPFADSHHIFREADADTHLKRVFCNLGQNVIQLCRCEHRQLEAVEGWPEYPSDDVMRGTIMSEVSVGALSLSKTSRRKLGL